MSEPLTVQDPDDPWGVDPVDRWVMLRAETCRTLLWHRDGTADAIEGLPPVPQVLADRMEAFARRYDELDDANTGFPEPFYWEQRSDPPSQSSTRKGARSPGCSSRRCRPTGPWSTRMSMPGCDPPESRWQAGS